MSWYYSQGEERVGPVDEAAFDALVREGTITAETLVWREGMKDWITHGKLADPLTKSSRVCAECGAVVAADEVVTLDGAEVCSSCKPLALQRMLEGGSRGGDAEAIRQAHISHEASVKSVGILYYLGGGFILLGGLVGGVGVAAEDSVRLESVAVTLILLALGAGQFWVGRGVRGLRAWARPWVGILSGIGLLGIPIGTLINGYILYLVFSKKGKMVFSEEYQDVISKTPHIRYQTSIVVKILVVLVLALMALGLVGVFVSSGGK